MKIIKEAQWREPTESERYDLPGYEDGSIHVANIEDSLNLKLTCGLGKEGKYTLDLYDYDYDESYRKKYDTEEEMLKDVRLLPLILNKMILSKKADLVAKFTNKFGLEME